MHLWFAKGIAFTRSGQNDLNYANMQTHTTSEGRKKWIKTNATTKLFNTTTKQCTIIFR